MCRWRSLLRANANHPNRVYRFSALRQQFRYITEAGLDLLQRLLTYDPQKRITAEEALEHPYFKESPAPKHPVSRRSALVEREDVQGEGVRKADEARDYLHSHLRSHFAGRVRVVPVHRGWRKVSGGRIASPKQGLGELIRTSSVPPPFSLQETECIPRCAGTTCGPKVSRLTRCCCCCCCGRRR